MQNYAACEVVANGVSILDQNLVVRLADQEGYVDRRTQYPPLSIPSHRLIHHRVGKMHQARSDADHLSSHKPSRSWCEPGSARPNDLWNNLPGSTHHVLVVRDAVPGR